MIRVCRASAIHLRRPSLAAWFLALLVAPSSAGTFVVVCDPPIRPASAVMDHPRLRPGEVELGAIRLEGCVASTVGRASLPEAHVRFGPVGRPGPFAALVRAERLASWRPAYLPVATGGDHVTVRVPLPTRETGAVEVTVVDISRSEELVGQPELIPDPLDASPIEGRRVLVLVHGMVMGEVDRSTTREGKIAVFRGLRSSLAYPAIRRLYKPFLYVYPTYPSVRDTARDLVRLLRREVDATGLEGAVLVGHSMGGHVIRRAMESPLLAGKVRLAITASAPHHGSIAASAFYANSRVAERIGWWAAIVLRLSHNIVPDTPALRDMCWDNYDGVITPLDQLRYGMRVNTELADWNLRWPLFDRLVCLQGSVSTLLGHLDHGGVPYEIFRLAQARWGPRFGNADPTVCLDSGTCAGLPVQERIVIPEYDHEQIIVSPLPVRAIVRLLIGCAERPGFDRLTVETSHALDE